jgi:Stress responsive A/B Barrel Domain
MKKIIILSSIILFASLSLLSQKKAPAGKLLRHVVLFTFKTTSTKEDVGRVVAAFAALPKQIKVIKAFEWGLNNSPENFHQGFTHCFVLTFDNEKDRDEVYQVHPAHKAFQEILKPHMEKVFVVDYQVEK